MNMLMNGTSPVGMVYNQSAENIAYDSNNSVKDMIDKAMEYHSGDTLKIGYAFRTLTGRVGWSGKDFYFDIPLDKKIGNDVNSITVTSVASNKNFYLTGDNQTVTKQVSDCTATTVYAKGSNSVALKLSFSTAPFTNTSDKVASITFDTGAFETLTFNA